MSYPYTLAAALVLASVYVYGGRLRASSHHRRWVSIAAGVSVATIFIDLLPEISESQAKLSDGLHGRAALFPEQAVYLAAMLGFVMFYGLEYMLAASAPAEDKPSGLFFSLQIAAFAGYSSLIAFHLLLVDHSLARERHGLYEKRGRWILALAVMAGWSAGILASVPDQWLDRITGFISGGVIMNSLVVELPEGRGGRFWFFAVATVIYSLLLIVVLG